MRLVVLLLSSVLAAGLAVGCRGRLPEDDAGEGEGEGEGEADPDVLRRMVGRGTLVAAPVGPDILPGQLPTPPASVVAVDLGDVVVDDNGRTGAFTVDVDDRLRGLMVVVVGAPEALVIPLRVEAPDGSLVVDDAPLPVDAPGHEQIEGLSKGFTGQFSSPGRVLPARGIGAFPIPSSPDVPLFPGRWSITLGQATLGFDDGGDPVPTPVSGAVHIVVLLRGAPVDGGGVGVTFHFTGAAGLTAASAPTSPAFMDAVSLTRSVLDDVEVDADDVAFVDLDDGASRQIVVLDEPFCDGGELDELGLLGEPDRLNVFVVDTFECGTFGPFLLGLAAGQPMVPFARTRRGGVVVAASFIVDEPELFARAMAHELGHLLGLFHTQENDRFGADIYDEIGDTGLDAEARENLMFFDVARVRDPVLSPGQGAQIRTMPLVGTVLP